MPIATAATAAAVAASTSTSAATVAASTAARISRTESASTAAILRSRRAESSRRRCGTVDLRRNCAFPNNRRADPYRLLLLLLRRTLWPHIFPCRWESLLLLRCALLLLRCGAGLSRRGTLIIAPAAKLPPIRLRRGIHLALIAARRHTLEPAPSTATVIPAGVRTVVAIVVNVAAIRIVIQTRGAASAYRRIVIHTRSGGWCTRLCGVLAR